MTELEHLKAVRDLISDESRWTQLHLACAEDGSSLFAGSPDAVKWCVYGAILKVASVYGLDDSSYNLATSLSKYLPDGYPDIVFFNDKSTHAELMAILDVAIKDMGG